MSPNTRGEYPYPKNRVYLSVAIAALSTILTTHILYFLEGKPILLLYYFASTSLITAIAFLLKSYLLPIRPKPSEKKSLKPREGSKLRPFVLFFCVVLALMFVPLLLVMVIDPYSWFIILVSLTSGVSISEVFFYIHTR